MIVALDKQNGIGKSGVIPWKLPSDLKLFKTRTLNHFVVVGKTTWDNMQSSLPGRRVIVLTNDLNYTSRKPLVYVAHNVKEVLNFLHRQDGNEVFIIGGGVVYSQFLDLANKLYITKILKTFECDSFFPSLDGNKWVLTSSKLFDGENLNYLIEEYTRNDR